MRYYELLTESRQPKLTAKQIKQKRDNARTIQAEKLAKRELYAHMYAVEKPHGLYMKEIEHVTALADMLQ